MKKKIMALCLVLAMAVVAVGGATLAYFTDQDQVNNTFTIGNISIDLYEKTDIDGDGNLEEQEFQQYLNYSDIMPGDALPKQAHIKNDGDYDAYVRVCVVMNNVETINDAIDDVYETMGYTAEQIQAVYDEVFEGWGLSYTKRNVNGNNDRRLWMKERANDSEVLFGGQIDMYCNSVAADSSMFDVKNTFKLNSDYDSQGFDYGKQGYYSKAVNADERLYVFYLKLAAGQDYTLFEGLNAPADFSNHAVQYKGKDGADDTIINQMDMFEGLEIGIYADAIQAANFVDGDNAATDVTDTAAYKAFTALEADHAMGWWN